MSTLGPELLNNFSFEQGQPNHPGGFTTQLTLPGWTTVAGSAPLEVINSPYGGGPDAGPYVTTNGTHALDSLASPGNIDIKQTFVNVDNAAMMHFEIGAAAQKVGNLVPPAGSHTDIIVNGVVVKSISIADFTQPGGPNGSGQIDYNHNHLFAFDVAMNHVGNNGGGSQINTVEIKSVGPVGFVGFAVDYISDHAILV